MTASLARFAHPRTANVILLLKVDEINFSETNNKTHKVLFENLTPLFPNDRLQLERGNGSTEDLTARIIDLVAPVGRGKIIIVSPQGG